MRARNVCTPAKPSDYPNWKRGKTPCCAHSGGRETKHKAARKQNTRWCLSIRKRVLAKNTGHEGNAPQSSSIPAPSIPVVRGSYGGGVKTPFGCDPSAAAAADQ